MVNSANALQSPAQALTLGTLRLQLSPTQATHILEGLGQRPLIEAYLETSEFAEDSKKLRGILTRLLDDGDLGFGGRWQVTGSQMEVTCWIVPMDADGSTWVDAGSNGRQSDLREMHESLFGEDGELVLALKYSVWEIVTREEDPRQMLDPRYTPVEGAAGAGRYFLNPQTGQVRRRGEYHQLPRGGIVGEQMGSGKSFEILALILLTLHLQCQPPRPTPQVEISAVSIDERTGRRSYMERPINENRRASASNFQPAKEYTLVDATLLIVPKGLAATWIAEIAKHFEEGTFKVWADGKRLPTPKEIALSNIIVMATERFSRAPHDSSLLNYRFKRIVVDEGHQAAQENPTSAIDFVEKLNAERRWLVSGTPTAGLHQGGTSSENRLAAVHAAQPGDAADLAQNVSHPGDEDGGQLARIIVLFLKADFFGSRRAFRNLILGPLGAAGASPAFGAVKRFRFLMNALIVKNAPEVVDAELQLPPQTISIVRLALHPVQRLTYNFLLAQNPEFLDEQINPTKPLPVSLIPVGDRAAPAITNASNSRAGPSRPIANNPRLPGVCPASSSNGAGPSRLAAVDQRTPRASPASSSDQGGPSVPVTPTTSAIRCQAGASQGPRHIQRALDDDDDIRVLDGPPGDRKGKGRETPVAKRAKR
ncbi:SNF2 family N-terminal domain-containing protein [Dioszegia hungarica]|uniref:SNF2 family N-terminal domain-containing protein n=1 Tax=Dioszegia hungarica TaxID=4972 RepID=A0AA38HAD8_9TREE|nr:SNF2 family N-terminal domain-containing protein [Dioszegia hungarica]KAI9637577.1 SNF2 family N-terminal domain-containing protein [Dioszegia hungarica]